MLSATAGRPANINRQCIKQTDIENTDKRF